MLLKKKRRSIVTSAGSVSQGWIHFLSGRETWTYLPTTISSRTLADFLLNLARKNFQMSMVKRVLVLLKIEVRSLIRAASMTANKTPRRPIMKEMYNAIGVNQALWLMGGHSKTEEHHFNFELRLDSARPIRGVDWTELFETELWQNAQQCMCHCWGNQFLIHLLHSVRPIRLSTVT